MSNPQLDYAAGRRGHALHHNPPTVPMLYVVAVANVRRLPTQITTLQVTEVARGLTIPPRLSSLPATCLGALAFSDALLLLTDASGSAVREPLLIPGRPLTITHSGHFLVIVSEDSGLTVFDVSTAKPVQSIPFAHDDPWVAASGRLPACADSAVRLVLDSGKGSTGSGGAVGVGHVLLATASTLFCLQPVELEEQVCDLAV